MTKREPRDDSHIHYVARVMGLAHDMTPWSGSPPFPVHETPNANGHDGLVVRRLSTGNGKDAVSNAALLAIRLASVPNPRG